MGASIPGYAPQDCPPTTFRPADLTHCAIVHNVFLDEPVRFVIAETQVALAFVRSMTIQENRAARGLFLQESFGVLSTLSLDMRRGFRCAQILHEGPAHFRHSDP